jgi:hypothetical protein
MAVSSDMKSVFGESQLILGWKMTFDQDPDYWLTSEARPGNQSSEDLIRIPASLMSTHTAIIAQSGSGKSTLLGRLIEEILIQTSANCLILDPNADFRRINEQEHSDLWAKARYDRNSRKGKLPHERSAEEFKTRWSRISHSMRVRTRIVGDPKGRVEDELKIWWPDLSEAFLAEDLDPMLHSELYHCHKFVKDFGGVFKYKYKAPDQDSGKVTRNFLDEAQEVFNLVRSLSQRETVLKRTLTLEFGADQIQSELKSRFKINELKPGSVPTSEREQTEQWKIERDANRFIESALVVADYVSPMVEKFYFGKVHLYQNLGILQTSATRKDWMGPLRLDVVDLPSLPDLSARLLVINAILTTTWDQAQKSWREALRSQDPGKDDRVPTFIVVDEAHNLIPKDARSKAAIVLREQFRRLVAEGRKYGLFLILVSQRPDKLDSVILSECENKAVMRLGSASMLDLTRKMLGLEDISETQLQKCLKFETGRALLAGAWSPGGPTAIYGAARRTLEGGRSLQAARWSVPGEIKHLVLAPEMQRVAIDLKEKYPAIVFVSGRFGFKEKARAMEENILKNGLLNDPFGPFIGVKLQGWLANNPIELSEKGLSESLIRFLETLTAEELYELDPTLTGHAFGIEVPDPEPVRNYLRSLKDYDVRLSGSDGSSIWHVQLIIQSQARKDEQTNSKLVTQTGRPSAQN